MWWDIIPSYAITGTCLYMPIIVAYVTNRLFLGTPYKRNLRTDEDSYLYLRDMRISGNDDPYNQKGLEGLGEEEKS